MHHGACLLLSITDLAVQAFTLSRRIFGRPIFRCAHQLDRVAYVLDPSGIKTLARLASAEERRPLLPPFDWQEAEEIPRSGPGAVRSEAKDIPERRCPHP